MSESKSHTCSIIKLLVILIYNLRCSIASGFVPVPEAGGTVPAAGRAGSVELFLKLVELFPSLVKLCL
jgi:hypothetical protein